MSIYNNKLITTPAVNLTSGHIKILEDLQANILKHHKKTHSKFIFIKFNETCWEEARIFLSNLARDQKDNLANDKELKLSSSAEQLGVGQFNKLTKNELKTNEIVCCYLTLEGYRFLKLPNLSPSGKAFRTGISSIKNGFNVIEEENPYFDNPHVMLMVASNNEKDVEKLTTEIKEKIQDTSIGNIEVQSGKMMKKDGKYIDHFGYVDGISQPRFFPSLSSKKSSFPEHSIAPLESVLIADKGGAHMEYSFGSFLVFLKFEQHLEAFDELVKDLKKLNLKNWNGDAVIKDDEDAKAMLMGRYSKGASILNKDFKDDYNFDNKFDYNEMVFDGREWKKDSEGFGCPFAAHARKANPRDSSNRYQNRDKIARRGTPYIEEKTIKDGVKKNEKGLLFMSFQRNIQEQFESLIIDGLHESGTHGMGMDFITGKKEKSRLLVGNPNKTITPKNPIVSLRGGAYFFAPSISFFKNILRFYPPLEKTMIKSSRQGDLPPSTIVPNSIFDEYGNIHLKPIYLNDYQDKIIDNILEDLAKEKEFELNLIKKRTDIPRSEVE